MMRVFMEVFMIEGVYGGVHDEGVDGGVHDRGCLGRCS